MEVSRKGNKFVNYSLSTTYFSIFLKSIFFILSFFLEQHKNIIESNNNKNNYMKQLLRLPLLKYTHTNKKNTYVKEKMIIIIIKRKTVPPPSSRKKRIPTTPKTRRFPRQQSRNRSCQLLPQRPTPRRLWLS